MFVEDGQLYPPSYSTHASASMSSVDDAHCFPMEISRDEMIRETSDVVAWDAASVCLSNSPVTSDWQHNSTWLDAFLNTPGAGSAPYLY